MPYGLYRFSEGELAKYLARIDCPRPAAPTDAALEQLHFNHIQNIVFENLDIHLGRVIEIDVSVIFDKIINRGRGGFCYELNALFASLLYSLGFEITVHACKVVTYDRKWIPFGHICLNVACGDKTWLADVGFGNSFQRPLEIGLGRPQDDEGGSHCLEKVDEGWFLKSKIDTDKFEDEYRFDLEPRHLDAFKERCLWTQTSEESGFTRRTFATRPHEGGRLTLLGLELRTFKDGSYKERKIASEERNQILVEVFGLPEEDVALLPDGHGRNR